MQDGGNVSLVNLPAADGLSTTVVTGEGGSFSCRSETSPRIDNSCAESVTIRSWFDGIPLDAALGFNCCSCTSCAFIVSAGTPPLPRVVGLLGPTLDLQDSRSSSESRTSPNDSFMSLPGASVLSCGCQPPPVFTEVSFCSKAFSGEGFGELPGISPPRRCLAASSTVTEMGVRAMRAARFSSSITSRGLTSDWFEFSSWTGQSPCSSSP
mmetsp:Transcript_839/g.1620  ORF Transcript_839/g.1620 Transcript_839/m.1620 type:complete len:210 (-) Transcript_839:1226-1855(-)